MPGKNTLVESFTPYDCLIPQADAAGRTGLYVNLKNAQRATIVFHVKQGNAATILLSVLQGTDEEGAGSKAITNNCPIWTNLDTATIDQYTRQTDAKTYTTDAGTTNKFVVFQIDPELHLDVANSFCSISLSTGASNAANITEATIFVEQRYQQPLPPHATDLD